MSTQTFTSYLAIMLFFSSSIFLVEQQQYKWSLTAPDSGPQLTGNAGHDEDFAHVYLYYPLEKSATGFSVFLNRKSVGKLNNGGRMECRLLLEGPVAVTILEGNAYREPLTQARNSRTVSVKKGKSYYFRVSSNGELEYMFITAKGEKSFAEAKDFVALPTGFTETADSSIPALSALTN